MAIETGLVVRMVYKLAYRQTEGFLHSIASLLGLGIEIPDYSTLCRRSRLLRKKLGCAPQKVDPVLIARYRLAMIGGCFAPVDPTTAPMGASAVKYWRPPRNPFAC